MSKPRKPRRLWTPAEEELLRRNYADSRTDDLATVFDRPLHQVYAKAKKLGLHKSEAYLASPDACRLRRGDNVGAPYRYPKGHVPANKGLRRPGWSPGDMASTQFKKGHKGGSRAIPVGGYRINPDGHVEIKLNETPGPYYLRWKPLHRHVWEQAHGAIPAGHVIAFKPGTRTADPKLVTLDRLECITHAENLRRNSIHSMPPQLAEISRLRGAITRQINKRPKESAPS